MVTESARVAPVSLRARRPAALFSGRLRETAVLFLLACLSAVFFHSYVEVTPWGVRTHDGQSQLNYVRRLRNGHAVPKAVDCWECTQPPAYYALADEWVRFAYKGEGIPTDEATEGKTIYKLDAVLGCLTALFFLLAARTLLTSSYERILAGTLVVFWPTLYIESTKAGNDVLLYFCASASLYGLVSWARTEKPIHLVLASLAAGLAANSKLNGYVVVAVFLSSFVARILRPPLGERRWPRGGVFALATVGACVGFSIFSFAHWKQWTTHVDWSSSGPLGAQDLTKDLGDFFPLSPSYLLGYPYVRFPASNFWDYLFRSSIFGEHSSGDPVMTTCARVMILIAAAFVLFIGAGLLHSARAAFGRSAGGYRSVLLMLVGFVAFVMVFRFMFPFRPHNDFRFALPVLGPCAILAARGFSLFRARCVIHWPNLAALPVWLVAVWCFLTTQVLFAW